MKFNGLIDKLINKLRDGTPESEAYLYKLCGFVSASLSWIGKEFFAKKLNVPAVFAVERNNFITNPIAFL
jgi:hypothetical protein